MKGGRVRVVYIPEYVKEVLGPRLSELKNNENLLSLTEEPFNDAYFQYCLDKSMEKNEQAGNNRT